MSRHHALACLLLGPGCVRSSGVPPSRRCAPDARPPAGCTCIDYTVPRGRYGCGFIDGCGGSQCSYRIDARNWICAVNASEESCKFKKYHGVLPMGVMGVECNLPTCDGKPLTGIREESGSLTHCSADRCTNVIRTKDDGELQFGGSCKQYCTHHGLQCVDAWKSASGDTCAVRWPWVNGTEAVNTSLGCSHVETSEDRIVCQCAADATGAAKWAPPVTHGAATMPPESAPLLADSAAYLAAFGYQTAGVEVTDCCKGASCKATIDTIDYDRAAQIPGNVLAGGSGVLNVGVTAPKLQLEMNLTDGPMKGMVLIPDEEDDHDKKIPLILNPCGDMKVRIPHTGESYITIGKVLDCPATAGTKAKVSVNVSIVVPDDGGHFNGNWLPGPVAARAVARDDNGDSLVCLDIKITPECYKPDPTGLKVVTAMEVFFVLHSLVTTEVASVVVGGKTIPAYTVLKADRPVAGKTEGAQEASVELDISQSSIAAVGEAVFLQGFVKGMAGKLGVAEWQIPADKVNIEYVAGRHARALASTKVSFVVCTTGADACTGRGGSSDDGSSPVWAIVVAVVVPVVAAAILAIVLAARVCKKDDDRTPRTAALPPCKKEEDGVPAVVVDPHAPDTVPEANDGAAAEE